MKKLLLQLQRNIISRSFANLGSSGRTIILSNFFYRAPDFISFFSLLIQGSLARFFQTIQHISPKQGQFPIDDTYSQSIASIHDVLRLFTGVGGYTCTRGRGNQ